MEERAAVVAVAAVKVGMEAEDEAERKVRAMRKAEREGKRGLRG